MELERTLNVTPESFVHDCLLEALYGLKLTVRCCHHSLSMQRRSIKTSVYGTRCWVDQRMSYGCLTVITIILPMNPDVNPSTIP
jgi:hypothetical protein